MLNKIVLMALFLALSGFLCAGTVLLDSTVTTTVDTMHDYLVFIACNAALGIVPGGCSTPLPVQINNGNPVPIGTLTIQESITRGRLEGVPTNWMLIGGPCHDGVGSRGHIALLGASAAIAADGSTAPAPPSPLRPDVRVATVEFLAVTDDHPPCC
jgi:hypothetical protein